MDNFKLVHYYLSYEIRGGATRSTGAEEHADYRKKPPCTATIVQ
jgi:hypothetical protein